jgi:23S rRNA (cytosine1962-C5)-methyltransferase
MLFFMGAATHHPLPGAGNHLAIHFREGGRRFQADVVHGQKTGFFFDQRDNRARVGSLAGGRSVLNLFAYTGGFSVYAGAGGARDVTSVDLAKPAIEEAQRNWLLNGLRPSLHHTSATDAFQFLEEARAARRSWDLVIVDPPSFAPAERHVAKAIASYQALFAAALHVLAPDGIAAFSSCSSHVPLPMFLELTQAAVSKARRRAVVLGVYGQPADHPFPLACTELQYLKFLLLQVR